MSVFGILQGTILGKIEFEDQPVEFEDPNTRNLTAEVSVKVGVSVVKVHMTIFGLSTYDFTQPSIECLILLNEYDFKAHIKWFVMFSWAKLKAS